MSKFDQFVFFSVNKTFNVFRAKLAESEAMVERLKRIKHSSPGLSVSRLGLLSPVHSSMSSMSQSFEAPLSPDNKITSIIHEAKKEVKRQKKKIKRSTSRLSQE